jgi:hypothetical protein
VDFCKLRSGLLDCYCLFCRRSYNKTYHELRARSHRKAVALNRRTRKDRNAKMLAAYLESHHCVDCGESDLRVLEFDHVRSNKLADVSQLLAKVTRWELVAAEIEKCQIRCANCHRRKTAKQRGWYADI